MKTKKPYTTESKPLFKQITLDDYLLTVTEAPVPGDVDILSSLACNIILESLPTESGKALPAKELMGLTGLKFRELKELISHLRYFYPICSKETSGGGYWLAQKPEDVLEFVKMIERRKAGYEKTIKIMSAHLINF